MTENNQQRIAKAVHIPDSVAVLINEMASEYNEDADRLYNEFEVRMGHPCLLRLSRIERMEYALTYIRCECYERFMDKIKREMI